MMTYTEIVEREIQIMESCVKTNGLTEHGKAKLNELKECRDAFKNLHLQNVRQRSYDWLVNVNKKYNIVMIWWRYDDKGRPNKIGWRLFNGKVYIRGRTIA